MRIVVIREQEELGFFSNHWLVIALAGAIGLQLLIIYNPLEAIIPLGEWFGVVRLGFEDWIIIGLGGIIAFVSSLFVSKKLSVNTTEAKN